MKSPHSPSHNRSPTRCGLREKFKSSDVCVIIFYQLLSKLIVCDAFQSPVKQKNTPKNPEPETNIRQL